MRPVLAGVALTLAACRPTPAPPTSPLPAKAPPSGSAVPDTVEAPPTFVSVGEAAQAIAKAWCLSGGDQFAPPGGDMEAWPPPLENCDDIEIQELVARSIGEFDAALFELYTPMEAQDVLVIRSSEGTMHTVIDHRLEDTSGEGPETGTTYGETYFRNIIGDERPEWKTHITYHEGDNFEADRCYELYSQVEMFMICRFDTEIECGTAVVADRTQYKPRPPEELYDCEDPPPEGTEIVHRGFENEVRIDGEDLVFSPSSWPFVEPKKPPYLGRVPIERLFEE